MMHKCIYLHGLNSSGGSYKAGVLRERLAPIPVLAPDYPAHQSDKAIERLSCFLQGLVDGPDPDSGLVLIGSSMGGFYGQYLARHFGVEHLFMINPALEPWQLLPEFIGQSMTTARGATYQVTREMIEKTRRYAVADPCDGIPTTIFIDAEDEVIPPKIAQGLYANCGRLIVFPGGDHSFQHLDAAIDVILEKAVSL